jgi:hypothetical protein
VLLTLPVAAHGQATQTVYYLCLDDSTIAEGTLPADVTPTAPSSGNWERITLQEIHDLGRYSPSEEEAAAKELGYWWCVDTMSPTLGRNSVEWGWLVLGQNTNNQKYVKGGAGSRRKWYNPGRVMAKAVLRKDGTPAAAATVDVDPWWEVKAVTPPVFYPKSESHFMTDSTEHYGNPQYYYYYVWPGVWW